MGRPARRRGPQARSASSGPASAADRHCAAPSPARHREGPAGCSLAAVGPDRAGGRAQLSRRVRTGRLPPGALLAAGQSRALAGGGGERLGAGAGDEGHRLAPGEGREPGLRLARTGARGALPPARAAYTPRGQARVGLCALERSPSQAGRRPGFEARSCSVRPVVRWLDAAAPWPRARRGRYPAGGPAVHVAAAVGLAAVWVDRSRRGTGTAAATSMSCRRARPAERRLDFAAALLVWRGLTGWVLGVRGARPTATEWPSRAGLTMRSDGAPSPPAAPRDTGSGGARPPQRRPSSAVVPASSARAPGWRGSCTRPTRCSRHPSPCGCSASARPPAWTSRSR